MPPINHAMASAGVAALALAVATAVAIYESEDVRRVAGDLRRRIAEAFQAIHDEFNMPPHAHQPRFNRPEDAEGVVLAHGLRRSTQRPEPGVDADAASVRRQREELMYWNAIQESKRMADEQTAAQAAVAAAKQYGRELGSSNNNNNKHSNTNNSRASRSSFDDFLRQEEGSAAGTMVFNTGAESAANRDGLTRRRGAANSPFVYANPFADENGIETDASEAASASSGLHGEMYHATPRVRSPEVASAVPAAPAVPAFPAVPAAHTTPAVPGITGVPPSCLAVGEWWEDDDSYHSTSEPSYATPRTASPVSAPVEPDSPRSETLSATAAGSEPSQDEEAFTSFQASHRASIQAWAQNSHQDFYSPLPMTPEPAASEADASSGGQATPTDSASVVDAAEVAEAASVADSRDYDMVSEDSGVPTPSSWSDISSDVSGSESPMHA